MLPSLDHAKSCGTSSADLSLLYQICATNVESLAYLNKIGSALCSISKSLRKILKQVYPSADGWTLLILLRHNAIQTTSSLFLKQVKPQTLPGQQRSKRTMAQQQNNTGLPEVQALMLAAGKGTRWWNFQNRNTSNCTSRRQRILECGCSRRCGGSLATKATCVVWEIMAANSSNIADPEDGPACLVIDNKVAFPITDDCGMESVSHSNKACRNWAIWHNLAKNKFVNLHCVLIFVH